MKKLGFTLAEVLVALGVVGLIAALTMPALQISVQKQLVGPALAKAINSLENANNMLLAKEGARNLTEVCIKALRVDDEGKVIYNDKPEYLTCLVQNNVLNATKEELKDDTRYLKDFKLTSAKGELPEKDSGEKYVLNDGITVYAWNGTWATQLKAGATSKYHPTNYTIYVDTNGPKQPNALGRDVFPLYVNANGDVIPYGGREWKDFFAGTTQEVSNTWADGYCDETGVKAYNGSIGDMCTGSIVDNGYKVIYPY